MTPGEMEIIRDIISEAVHVSTEYAFDDGPAIVEAFLEGISVESALLLAREVIQRHRDEPGAEI